MRSRVSRASQLRDRIHHKPSWCLMLRWKHMHTYTCTQWEKRMITIGKICRTDLPKNREYRFNCNKQVLDCLTTPHFCRQTCDKRACSSLAVSCRPIGYSPYVVRRWSMMKIGDIIYLHIAKATWRRVPIHRKQQRLSLALFPRYQHFKFVISRK